ncbi:uncharacterized protein [Prorops nasuta]|uniref:uncharacterized protein n=1 Tax=Prorops nasuta TaxID=863751 RepID=UPI0034CF4A10
MGNQMTRIGNAHNKKTETARVSAPASKTTQSSSVIDNGHNYHSQFFPIDCLAKILLTHAQREEYSHGITKSIFTKYLFPNYPNLSEKLFTYLYHYSNSSTPYLTVPAFKQQTEKFLAVMNDQKVLENYVKMYSNINGNGEVTSGFLKELLMICYQIATNSTGLALCPHLEPLINSITTSCFHGKETLSTSYVSNWIWQHCPNVISGLHRFVIHVLTTAYRNDKAPVAKEQLSLEVDTPAAENSISQNGLPLSYIWILSSTLPVVYLQGNIVNKDIANVVIASSTGNIVPRHWTLLYSSNEHGTGANRFLHHVLGYRGPTILFIRAESLNKDVERPTFCVCSAVEWRESHLYWGDEDSICVEIFPSYKIVEKGTKTLYLNTGIRGYPHGLRFGSNPRSPSISIDDSFSSVSVTGVPYRIANLEVWGCGNQQLRERQLDIKKWQVKEAEKQRIVKLSAAEWLDHPDRYLLELAGRTSYNKSNN